MTKEEIALQHGLCTCATIYTSRGFIAPDCPWHAFEVETAMDAYARQEAIGFTNWILKNDYRSFEHKSGDIRWLKGGTSVSTTSAILYDLYLTHKNKNNG